MQCAYFCVQLSEAIIGRSSIIQDKTIQTKYSATTRCVLKHIYNNIYGLINETGLYNRNKVLSLVIYNPRLSGVINHKTSDFISTIPEIQPIQNKSYRQASVLFYRLIRGHPDSPDSHTGVQCLGKRQAEPVCGGGEEC